MRAPKVIRRQIDDLERRFTGPIPRDAVLTASLPAPDRPYADSDIDAAADYYDWLYQNRTLQWRGVSYWAAKSLGRPGLQAAVDRQRLQTASRRMSDAFIAREAWTALRTKQRNASDSIGKKIGIRAETPPRRESAAPQRPGDARSRPIQPGSR